MRRKLLVLAAIIATSTAQAFPPFFNHFPPGIATGVSGHDGPFATIGAAGGDAVLFTDNSSTVASVSCSGLGLSISSIPYICFDNGGNLGAASALAAVSQVSTGTWAGAAFGGAVTTDQLYLGPATGSQPNITVLQIQSPNNQSFQLIPSNGSSCSGFSSTSSCLVLGGNMILDNMSATTEIISPYFPNGIHLGTQSAPSGATVYPWHPSSDPACTVTAGGTSCSTTITVPDNSMRCTANDEGTALGGIGYSIAVSAPSSSVVTITYGAAGVIAGGGTATFSVVCV